MKKSVDRSGGFTLIELSIVLVIIGLIVGGVLVGRDLIAAAAIRSQISQIEKYQQAVNTFRGKYGYLPGDIPDPDATRFGFSARSSGRGRGDGNGLLEAPDQYFPPATGWPRTSGELGAFWLDISQARLIDGTFSGCSGGWCINNYTGGDLDSSLPKAKIGDGSYVNVFSGGWQLSWPTGSDNKNYFLVAKQFYNDDGDLAVNTSLTVSQAYAIDQKMDDGLPQYRKVMALVMNLGHATIWARGSNGSTGVMGGGAALDGNAPLDSSNVDAVSPDDQTCYDTRGNAGVRAEYSITWNNGTMPNCTLAFQFQ